MVAHGKGRFDSAHPDMKTLISLTGFPKYDPDGVIVVDLRLPLHIQDQLRPLVGPPSFDREITERQARAIWNASTTMPFAHEGLDWFIEESQDSRMLSS
jgi:hypothetical protein